MFEMGGIRRIHLVGIGGAGMAGIAQVLLELGFLVSGSDLAESNLTKKLLFNGAKIYIGHSADYVLGADIVVYSSAVGNNNVELLAARKLQIPVLARAEMLGELMRFRFGIAISGTHGKTTTTSLVTAILLEADCDPTFVIGGKLNQTATHARLGLGRFLVAEADESDASFLHLKPMLSVITNIDADHLATYQNKFACLCDAFVGFVKNLPFYGKVVLCVDDPVIRNLLVDLPRKCCTYGFSAEADYRAVNIKQVNTKTYFTVKRPGSLKSLNVIVNLPGRHNVLNALAAISVATELNIADSAILQALENFSGIERRFQIYGEYKLQNGSKFILLDDYGHHPKEIAATMRAIKASWPDKRIVMVYQPHRYSRTKDLFADFCEVLLLPDKLLLLEVYSAGEEPIVGATSGDILTDLHDRGQFSAELLNDNTDITSFLQKILLDGDVLVMQGAGSIGDLAKQLAENVLGRKQNEPDGEINELCQQ